MTDTPLRETTDVPLPLAVAMAVVGSACFAAAGYFFCAAQHAVSFWPALGYLVGMGALLGFGLGSVTMLVLERRIREEVFRGQ